MWFDERAEANAIAAKSKYDDIYDAAVAAFKRQRAALTSSAKVKQPRVREKENQPPISNKNVAEGCEPFSGIKIATESSGLSVGERCAERLFEAGMLADRVAFADIAAIINQQVNKKES